MISPFDPFAVALIALALDALVGDPPALYRAIPHPVALIGAWIARLDARWNEPSAGETTRFARGLAATLAVVAACALAGAVVSEVAARAIPGGWVIEAAAASALLAFRGLRDHVRRIALALGESLAAARAAVAHVVGRDPESLDEAGVARAAVETTAENFADGVVAPVFWYVLLGLPGLFAYKAINTLDSMIGHLDARHRAFGRAAARIDDAANWLPARLAAALIALAALAVPRASARAAVRAAWRDACHHRSPNAGWPEAAMAGALGLAIAGPRRYAERAVDDAWMGDGRRDLCAGDVHAGLRLYLGATLALAAALAIAGAY